MKWTRLITLGALPVIILATALLPASAQDENLDSLRIAFIGRESGRAAELDRQLYQAAVTAAEQINAGDDDDEAGVESTNGDRYVFEVVYYSADTSEDALDALNDALEDDAIAVLGPHERELAEAVQDAGTQGLAVLLGAADAPDGENLFRVTASLDDRAQAAADYLVNERHYTRIGVLASNTDEALAGADAFKTAAGDDVIALDLVREADEEDFTADVRALRDADAEALFVWALDSQSIDLLAALRDGGWDGEIVYAGLDAAFVSSAGAELTAGLYGLMNWTDAAYDAASADFVADYQAQWGTLPPEAAASIYDAVYLLADSVADAGIEPAAIRSDLAAQTDFAGVQGSYDNASTDALRVVQVLADGRFIEVARYADGLCQTCPDTWLADTTDESTTSSETYRIGLIGTLDGAAEATGEQIEQAARLAVREINEAGGVVGANGVRYTLDLVTYSAQTSEAAGTAFQQAVSDGVQIVIGPDYNSQVLPGLFRAEEAQIVQLVSATSDQVTLGGGSYVYQMRAADTVLASASASYLLDVRELTRFATVAVRTDYGLDSVEAFAETLAVNEDAELLLELEHDVDATDFSALAEQIVGANVEALAVWSTQPAFTALANELAQRGWQGVLVYGYLTPEFAATLGTLPFELLAPVNWWSNSGDWIGQDFSTRYTERYGEAPIPQTASYYDAIYLLAAQLDGGSADGVRDGLSGLESFIGVQGSYHPQRYGTGELTREVVIVQMNNGAITQVARYDDGICFIGCGG
ncbi:MAG: ABC transporter substrate-binding protein [Anaerolineae bacterium]|nr:ABC transporter substrate-binding protein [Anaerolineae bacterium]